MSKNLSELALSDGVTSQFQPSGIGSGMERGVDAGRLIDGGVKLGLNMEEDVGLIGDIGVESPGGGIVMTGGVRG